MAKKRIMQEALIEAEEIEKAAIENAKDMVIESFQPNFVDFFKDVLTESMDGDEDDVYGDSDPEDDELEEGNEHDIGKETDQGRLGTDAAVDDSEENLKADEKDNPMKEGQYDDVSGDPTPEKGQAGLPNAPKTPDPGDSGRKGGNMFDKGDTGWKAEGPGHGGEDPEKNQGDIQGTGTPGAKKTAEGWEDEGSSGEGGEDPEKNKGQIPNYSEKPKVKLKEAEDDEEEEVGDEEPKGEMPPPSGDEEGGDSDSLDVPPDLFGDDGEDDDLGGEEGDGGEDLKMSDDLDGEEDDDVNINIDMDDDGGEEAPELDIDSGGEEGPEDELGLDDEEEFEEGLYMRKEGEFRKVTPAEYLQTRLGELEEENRQLTAALAAMRGQLGETHLFNAKLAHQNKLFMSGVFNNYEKESISERLDSCETIDEVKELYKTIVREVKEKNPLDDFSRVIKETRASRSAKSETIHESSDVKRMKTIMEKLDRK